MTTRSMTALANEIMGQTPARVAATDVARMVWYIIKAETIGWQDDVATLSGQGFLTMAIGWPSEPFNSATEALEVHPGKDELEALKDAYTRAGEWADSVIAVLP